MAGYMPNLLLLPSYSYIGLIDKISAGIARPAVSAGVELVAARCYATAVLAMGLCLCLSVCLSQVGVLLKRLKIGSYKQHHTIAQGL